MEHSEIWLQGMKEALEAHIAEGNYANCLEVIRRVREEGFEIEAHSLQTLLREATLGDFLIESNPTLI